MQGGTSVRDNCIDDATLKTKSYTGVRKIFYRTFGKTSDNEIFPFVLETTHINGCSDNTSELSDMHKCIS